MFESFGSTAIPMWWWRKAHAFSSRVHANTAINKQRATNDDRPATEEAQMMALLEVISSLVLYNTQAVVSRLDIEALSM